MLILLLPSVMGGHLWSMWVGMMLNVFRLGTLMLASTKGAQEMSGTITLAFCRRVNIVLQLEGTLRSGHQLETDCDSRLMEAAR